MEMEQWPWAVIMVLVFSLCIIGIVFFVVVGIMTGLFNKTSLTSKDPKAQQKKNPYDEDEIQILRATGNMLDDQRVSKSQHYTYNNNTQERIQFRNAALIDQVQDIINLFFIRQTTFMFAFGLLGWVVFFGAFNAKYSILWSLIALVTGLVGIICATFITLKFSVNYSVKFLNESLVSRGFAYSFGWAAGAAFTGGICSVMIGLYYALLSIVESFLLSEADYGSSDKFISLEFIMSSFIWGVLSGVIFYRQIGFEVGKGLLSGADMLAQEHTDHLFEINTIQDEIVLQGNIIGNKIGCTLCNILDFIAISSTVCIIFPTLLTQSAEIQQGGEIAPFYWPGLSLMVSIFIQLLLTVLTFMARSVEDEDQSVSPATFAAKQNLIQVLLTKLLTMIAFAILPYWVFSRDEMSLGEANHFLYIEKINTYSIIACSQIGMITHAFLIFTGELFTSSAFKVTKEISLEQMKGSGFGLSKAASSAALGNAIILIIIGVSMSMCFWFASFLGIALGLIGLINTPVLDMTIDLFSGAAREGSIFARLEGMADSTTRNIRNLARGAQNYSSYIELTNAAAVFYINVILLGLIGYMSEFTSSDFMNSQIVLGWFIGGATAYVLKWSTNSSIANVAKSIRTGNIIENNQDGQIRSNLNQDPTFKAQAVKDYVLKKFAVDPVVRMIVTILVLSGMIMLTAWIWGPKMILGFIVGLNFIGLHITIYSIVYSNANKNARILNQEIQSQRDPHERHLQGVLNSVNSDICSNTSESNGLLIYLLYCTLFVVMGMDQYWSKYGYWGRQFDELRNGIVAPNDAE